MLTAASAPNTTVNAVHAMAVLMESIPPVERVEWLGRVPQRQITQSSPSSNGTPVASAQIAQPQSEGGEVATRGGGTREKLAATAVCRLSRQAGKALSTSTPAAVTRCEISGSGVAGPSPIAIAASSAARPTASPAASRA